MTLLQTYNLSPGINAGGGGLGAPHAGATVGGLGLSPRVNPMAFDGGMHHHSALPAGMGAGGGGLFGAAPGAVGGLGLGGLGAGAGSLGAGLGVMAGQAGEHSLHDGSQPGADVCVAQVSRRWTSRSRTRRRARPTE